MIPSAFAIPVLSTSSAIGAVFGPAVVIGLVVALVVLGGLVAQLAVAERVEPAGRTMPDVAAKLPLVVRRAA